MQWASVPSNTIAQALMKGYNSNSTNVCMRRLHHTLMGIIAGNN